MKNSKIAIIISTYSQDKLLEKNIESIVNNTLKIDPKICLIDDASDNRIGEKIKNKFPFVEVSTNKQNFGFSKSYNLGIMGARKKYNPDWFLIYNDDCEFVGKGFLDKFLDKVKKFPKVGIFGCKLIYPEGSIQWGIKKSKPYFFEKKGTLEKLKEFSKDSNSKEVIGAFMLIKKEVFEKIGLFDEKFSPFYGEESDLCLRALKAGWDIKYFGNFEIVHHRNKSISKLSEKKVWFIKKRNSIRLEFKHYPLWKIFYYGFIHFGSVFKKNNFPFTKKINLLTEAYLFNFKEFFKIKQKKIL